MNEKDGGIGKQEKRKEPGFERKKGNCNVGIPPRKESTQQYSSLALVSVYFFHISTPFCEGNPVGCRYSPVPTII